MNQKRFWPALLLSLAGAAGGGETYVFTLDGKPFSPHVYSMCALSDQPQAGDVIWLGRVPVTLGAETRGDIKTAADEAGYYFEEAGKKKWIAVNVRWTYKDKDKVVLNPLADLADAEVRGLWGIRIDEWNDAIAAKLKHADPERVCITLGSGAASSKEGAFPPLPEKLRYLNVDMNSSDGLKDYSRLAGFSELRFLHLHRMSRGPLDTALIKNNRQLQYLDLRGEKLSNTQHLAALVELRTLRLGWSRDLAAISFAKDMKELRVLDVSSTKVADLSPLDGMLELAEVDANQSAVLTLPSGALPKLRTLKIMSVSAQEGDVAAFRKSHPACTVLHRWDQALKAALADVTRLRVRTHGTCCRTESREKTLFEEKDAAAIRKLVEILEIDEDNSGFHCMCCGDPTLEFYKDGKLVAMLGFHHGRSLRWPGGWPADGLMKGECAELLMDWLSARGVTGPRKEVEETRARERADQRKFERALAGLSGELRRTFTEGNEEFDKAVKKEIPDPAERIRILLRILGTGNGRWGVSDWIESSSNDLLKDYSAAALGPVVEAALLGDDRRLRRGAARLWLSYSSPLEEWKPEQSAKLRNAVLAVQQVARDSSLRKDAISNVLWRASELTPDDVGRAILSALSDPVSDVRAEAILTAGILGHSPSIPRLMSALRKEQPRIAPLPDVPADEKADTEEPKAEVLSMQETMRAALALGYLRHAEAKPVLEARLAEVTPKSRASLGYGVALALLGDMDKLPSEVFTVKDDSGSKREIQFAAVEAIVRVSGAQGFDLAINGKYDSSYMEEEVALKLIAMLRKLKAPGHETLRDKAALEGLRKWRKGQGAEFNTKR